MLVLSAKELETARRKNPFPEVATDKFLHGVGRSKLADRAEKPLGVEVTARNLRTVRKLREMSRDQA